MLCTGELELGGWYYLCDGIDLYPDITAVDECVNTWD